MPDAQDVLDFWFDPSHEALWFERNDAFDAAIRERFGVLHARALRGELDGWAGQPESWLALLILLDQFSRNLHRGDRRAFEGDARAQQLVTVLRRNDDRHRILREEFRIPLQLMQAERVLLHQRRQEHRRAQTAPLDRVFDRAPRRVEKIALLVAF